MMQMVFAKIIERAFQPQVDPMRDSMSNIVKLMALQMQNSQQQLENQLRVQQSGGDSTSDLLKAILPDLIRQRNTPPPAPQQGPGMEQLLGILQFGMQLRDQYSGQDKPPEEMADKMLKIMPQLVESIGPSFIVALAQSALPAEKARAVTDAVNAHMRAREAEARESATYDTDGENVA